MFYFIILMSLFFCDNSICSTNIKSNDNPIINLKDKKSLENGAIYFMKNCIGCHELKYVRYKFLVQNVTIINNDKDIVDYIKNNWTNGKEININYNINNSLSIEDGKKWFGVNPPDLSLISKYRGSKWIYLYLKGFYKDSNKMWKVNNIIFPDVAMPHILSIQQGIKIPIIITKNENFDKIENFNIKDLKTIKSGILTENEYNSMINDITNFLEYVSDPNQIDRQKIGYYVLIFIFLFIILTYLLKKEYWKDIK